MQAIRLCINQILQVLTDSPRTLLASPRSEIMREVGFHFQIILIKTEELRKFLFNPDCILIGMVLSMQILKTQNTVFKGTPSWCRRVLWCALGLAFSAPATIRAAAPATCTKVVLAGQVAAAHEWKQPFGQGWVFRVVPILPGTAGYSGWDLVVDRDPPAGFPDALLLATPPYNSISEREIGTTFGLRAQDAFGWNPRSFRFLTSPADLRESQKLFQILTAPKPGASEPATGSKEAIALKRQLEIIQKSSSGQFRILDATFAPGTADAAPYAEKWAMQAARTSHTLASSSQPAATPLGEFDWMRFSITLWLPAQWNAPKSLQTARAPCSE